MLAVNNNLLNNISNDSAISQDKVVRLGFRVSATADGRLLQYGDDLVYLHGGYGGAFPKVELAMEGQRVGDRVTVELSPEEGYGVHRPELVMMLSGDTIDGEVPEIGEAVDGCLSDGRSLTFTVAAVNADGITLDGNHPFAGKHLQFDFEVLEVRDSSAAERRAGFAFDAMFS